MARIGLTPTEVRVTFTRGERLLGVLRDIRVPFANVASVAVVADALGAVRGLRAPGTAIPRRLKIGHWRSKGTWHLVAVRRGVPAVDLEVSAMPFARLLISVSDAEAVAAAIEPRLGEPASAAK